MPSLTKGWFEYTSDGTSKDQSALDWLLTPTRRFEFKKEVQTWEAVYNQQ